MGKSLKTITSLAFFGLLLAVNEGLAAGQTGTPEEAKAMLERLDMVGKPLDLKFAALDGRAVDLASMRGNGLHIVDLKA